jgi:acetate kinase
VNSIKETPHKPERALHVLALNSGSSSLKFGLYRVRAASTDPLITGEAEAIGEKSGAFHAKDALGHTLLHERVQLPSQQEAIARVASLLSEQNMPAPQSIGHRIVHGGPQLKKHCRISRCFRAAAHAGRIVRHPVRAVAFPRSRAGRVF